MNEGWWWFPTFRSQLRYDLTHFLGGAILSEVVALTVVLVWMVRS